MSKLTDIKGIGAKVEQLLNKLGIFTIDELITYYPSRYEILKRSDLTKANPEDKVMIDGRVDSVPVVLRFNKGLNKMNFRLSYKDGVIGVSIFNRAFMKTNLKVGTSVIAIGKYDAVKNILTAADIRFGSLSNEEKIEPVYHLTSGITNKTLGAYINLGLMTFGKDVSDGIPLYLQEKYHFYNKKTSLNIIHNPSDLKRLKIVQERLKYEELFEFMAKINYLKAKKKKTNGIMRNITDENIQNFIKLLPFKLTNDQVKVINEIVFDMNNKHAMNRLLQGDVGSGKTIVSIAAMYFNKLSGYQSALMAPTEILATQHFNNIKRLLGNQVKVELLIGSIPKKDKLVIYNRLEKGDIDIIIGTHALIQEDVKYANLGLVVTDEQHRFGVNQRSNLRNKGQTPDVLYMSATPIPRTFALTIYGDMDISIIKEMPPGREIVKTYVKSNNEITDVLSMMLDELNKEHQIYVVAPLIEGEDSDLISVNELRDKMESAFGKNSRFKDKHYKIEVLHGKMAGNLKDNIMLKFKKHEINILISTTVIEVGVDVPDASLMVIFDANRFGLSTLHQLRGRVGRSDISSQCVLVSKEETERLKILEKTNDGFVIAEEDFKLRGSGDLFGTKQSGDMNFKIANLKEDYQILLAANEDAKDFWKRKDEDLLFLKKKIIDSIEVK